MAINLSSLAPATTKITALSNLILVTPNSNLGYQPQNPNSSDNLVQSVLQQPKSLIFHYEGEQTAALESDITDHFVENNSAVQDQIALKPIVITTHGFIGELNDVPPFALAILKTIAEKLTTIGPYAPQISVTAQLAYSEAFFAYQVAANAINAASSVLNWITGEGTQNRQQQMFNDFKRYYDQRTLFTVQTPWNVFNNMAIKSLRAIQDAETRVITDFEISFKQIQYASVASSSQLAAILSGRGATQASGSTNNGASSGSPGPSTSSVIGSTVAP